MTKKVKQKFSGKLFYRVYFVLVICIILIGIFLDSFIDHTDSKKDTEYLKNLYTPTFLLIKDKLKKTDQDLWSKETSLLSNQINLPIYLYHINDFASNQDFIKSLSYTKLIELYDENDTLSLYMKIESSPYIIEVQTHTFAYKKSLNWVPVAFYFLIALVIFILVQPFAKQLLQIRSAAVQFGKGDFSTRITMPKNSTLFPITDAFDTMTQEIESLMLRQRDLTNAVSHELRTPLARLKFAFELLDSQTTDKKTMENINHMRADVAELEVLINEMLRYAEASQIEVFVKKDLNITELIKNTVRLIKIDDKNIVNDTNINKGLIIQGDEPSLIRALSNIIRNSISFADSLCHINAIESGNMLVIEISDDGPGISQKYKDKIFEPFFKVNHIKRKSGTGLGLAIANTIIKKHNGTINIINGHLKGACFEIRIPLE